MASESVAAAEMAAAGIGSGDRRCQGMIAVESAAAVVRIGSGDRRCPGHRFGDSRYRGLWKFAFDKPLILKDALRKFDNSRKKGWKTASLPEGMHEADVYGSTIEDLTAKNAPAWNGNWYIITRVTLTKSGRAGTRMTADGFWSNTGRNLVFRRGNQKEYTATKWAMKEYSLDQKTEYVLCEIYETKGKQAKKKRGREEQIKNTGQTNCSKRPRSTLSTRCEFGNNEPVTTGLLLQQSPLPLDQTHHHEPRFAGPEFHIGTSTTTGYAVETNNMNPNELPQELQDFLEPIHTGLEDDCSWMQYFNYDDYKKNCWPDPDTSDILWGD